MAIFTILPGQPMAAIAARHLLATHGERLAEAVLLLPTRRACNLMRLALVAELQGQTALLPRILPLGDLEQELPGLLHPGALPDLIAIPPAMAEWHRLALLMRQVMLFEQRRSGHTSFAHALGLARDLARLQDDCARHNVALTMETLGALEVDASYAAHWESALAFLSIVTATWPVIEEEEGAITAPARQQQLLALLAINWEQAPPPFPVIAIGSTASHPATARLMRAIAGFGDIILPGLDPAIAPEDWQCIAPGHPLFHLKRWLDSMEIGLQQVAVLGEAANPKASLWLTAMACYDEVPKWRDMPPLQTAAAPRLIPCAHGEEEARVISLLIREALETPGSRTALVTPDEGLMERVSAHLARYGIAPDRIKHGTLAQTETGSLWRAMLDYIAAPSRMLPLLALLRHPLLSSHWPEWLREAEPRTRGLVRHAPGQLPPLPPELRERPEHRRAEQLIAGLAGLARRSLTPSQWVGELRVLLSPFAPDGTGGDAVADALDALSAADMLGTINADAFATLLEESFATAWRGDLYDTHPGITMLTPLEARLQQFDRVILANMQDGIWPGLARPSAWLNLAQQATLGLPAPEEQLSLMAHDLLLLGSQHELFLTWPEREGGAPTTRSRYIERLVALMELQGMPEATFCATEYLGWAHALYEAPAFREIAPPAPAPIAARRPKAVDASALDRLTTDPYYLYARYVLKLRELDPIDAEPEAKEFGTLTHAALAELTDHWNREDRAATRAEIESMASKVLNPFAARPEVHLFWRQRLENALGFVNDVEANRRARRPHVQAERAINDTLILNEEGTSLTLRGRIDRLEEGSDGVAIGDYKTGLAPTTAKLNDGSALQLLAYALLLELQGHPIAELNYWQLPASRRGGIITSIAGETLEEQGLLSQAHALLADFMHPETALRARPVAATQTDSYITTYDGVSRYDEWAG